MKNLPIGISTFEKIIKENYVYVDKTTILHKIITSGQYYFLSRPRRFGKSLTISTLEAIFSGKKELFSNLSISKTDYAWPMHPIIRLDLAGRTYPSPERLRELLTIEIEAIANSHGITLGPQLTLEILFERCIEHIKNKKGSIVLLIDEYDKPITDHLDNPELADQMRDVLGEFYGVIKKVDKHLKFVFITGVSRFSRASIFSKLNNLRDISTEEDFATIVGYTEQELVTYLDDYITALACKLTISRDDTIDRLRLWYDGYCFSENVLQKLYSPQTVMNALAAKRFKNYWITTGSSSFLIKLLKHYDYAITEFENTYISEDDLSPGDASDLDLAAILFQAGYLTIKAYEGETDRYLVGYPNHEVRTSFLQNVLTGLVKKKTAQFRDDILFLQQALSRHDINQLCKHIYQFFTGIPYELGTENHYQLVLFTLLSLAGQRVYAEESTNIGRIDITVEIEDAIFIFELKKNKSAQEALNQIIDKKYAEKFIPSGKKIFLIGLDFDVEQRNLRE